MKYLKRLFLFGLLILVYSNGWAQRLKFDDLLYGINHSLSEIEDYVLNKGLSYDRSDNLTDHIKSYSFSRDNNNFNYLAYSVEVFDNYVVTTSITTMKLDEYQQLRVIVKNQGFERLENGMETSGKMLFSYYHKENYEVCFAISNLGNNEKMYSISISNIARRTKALRK